MRMRILGHRIVVLLGMMLMVLGCVTPPGPLMEGEETSPRPSPRGEGGACLTLVGIDSLMWQQPDSAFALLQAFAASPEADSLDGFDLHYFHLLLSELLYKNDYQQTNRKDLLRAVAYFDSLTLSLDDTHRPRRPHRGLDPRSPVRSNDLVFLTARAHYINGVGYYERDSVVEACAEYLETLEIMEGNFEEKELVGHKARFMAYTYNRLGYLFSEQFMMDPSIACYEKSLTYNKIEPTSAYGESNTLFQIGKQYDKKNEIGIAKSYFEQAMEGMKGGDNLLYRDIISCKAVCDYQLGRDYEKVMDELRQVVARAESETELLNRYLTISSLFFEEGIYDSALYYLVPVYQGSGDKLSHIQSVEYLDKIYHNIGETGKADEYVIFLAEHKKSEGENKALVSKLDGLYQDYLHKKQEKQAEKAQEKSIRKTAGIFLLVTVMVVLAVVILSKLKHKKLLKEQQREADRMLESEERSHQQEMESVRQAHQVQQAALSGRLRRSNVELRELKEQIRQKENMDAKSMQAISFAEESVCRLIMDRVNDGQFKSKVDCRIYKQYALDKQHLFDLREAADRHYAQYTLRLRETYPELSNIDIDYCCLYLLNLTNADVAALMQLAYNTVVERKSKIQKIINPGKPLPIALMEIANCDISI